VIQNGRVDRLVQAIVLVEDLATARRRMTALGFAVEEGGRHPGRGTANLIVPFGDQYLEVLAVVDENEARSSPHGQPVLAALSRRGFGLARWSVEPSDIDATAERLGLLVERRQRIRSDGVTVRWSAVAVDAAWEQPWKCAYMAWDDPQLHPGRQSKRHPNGATGFASLDVVVPTKQQLLLWLDGAIPATVEPRNGEILGPSRLLVSTPSGPLEVR
jgi:hypothetical protein